MPLTAFTVSELLYHYIRLTCEKPSKEQKDDDEDDDASSVGSAVVDPVVSQEELVCITNILQFSLLIRTLNFVVFSIQEGNILRLINISHCPP